jgi:diacylglycerol O-acyltransferase / wax synthase
MGLMPITDAIFLIGENPAQPMHVGGLQVFELPEGAPRTWVRDLHRGVLDAADEVQPLFRRRASRSAATFGQWSWDEAPDLDLEHHVRLTKLPRPGKVRDLLALTSELHGTHLDRDRPLWEAHLVDGLQGRRFALYTKLHHSLLDGVSALRLLRDSLSDDPDERDQPAPFAVPRRRRSRSSAPPFDALGLPAAGVRAVLEAAEVGRRTLDAARAALDHERAALPFRAPPTVLNGPVAGGRRYAADSWDLDRVRAVGKDAGATVNDVVLAMSAGALRAYLAELDALPDQPLIAMVPVALRSADESGEGGNSVAAILADLATDEPDPHARLARIAASVRSGRDRLAGLSPMQASAISSLAVGGVALSPLVARGLLPPPYNLVISNIPGPSDPLYWNGARLQGIYPLSIPMAGQAFNITVTSYAGHLEVGLTGCDRTVPRLQRILGHLEDALADLER